MHLGRTIFMMLLQQRTMRSRKLQSLCLFPQHKSLPWLRRKPHPQIGLSHARHMSETYNCGYSCPGWKIPSSSQQYLSINTHDSLTTGPHCVGISQCGYRCQITPHDTYSLLLTVPSSSFHEHFDPTSRAFTAAEDVAALVAIAVLLVHETVSTVEVSTRPA